MREISRWILFERYFGFFFACSSEPRKTNLVSFPEKRSIFPENVSIHQGNFWYPQGLPRDNTLSSHKKSKGLQKISFL